MGNSYRNVVLRADIDSVADILQRLDRRAYVAAHDGVVVVYDERAEGEEKALEALVALLSSRLGRPALGFSNYDDDVLEYLLAEEGRIVDRYDSYPGLFKRKAGDVPVGGDARRLCAAFGVPRQESAIAAVLRQAHREFVVEIERHEQLLQLLGLPTDFPLLGYEYVDRGELAEVAPHVAWRAVGGARQLKLEPPGAPPKAQPINSAEYAALVAEAQEQRQYVSALVLNEAQVPPRFEKLLGRGKQNGYVVLHHLNRHLLRQHPAIEEGGRRFRVDDLTGELLGERDVEYLAVPRLLARALGIAPLTGAEIAELDDRGSKLHQRYQQSFTRAIAEVVRIGPLVG